MKKKREKRTSRWGDWNIFYFLGRHDRKKKRWIAAVTVKLDVPLLGGRSLEPGKVGARTIILPFSSSRSISCASLKFSKIHEHRKEGKNVVGQPRSFPEGGKGTLYGPSKGVPHEKPDPA